MEMPLKRSSPFCLFTCSLSLLLLTHAGHTDSREMTQTKNQLKQLDNKMSQIKHHLSTAHSQQGMLTQELARTEKTIRETSEQLKKTQHMMLTTQQQIATLQGQINRLTDQLHTQERLLAQHIQARYKLGESQPIQWMLNQDRADKIDRLLTFHQYLLHSRQQAMDAVSSTQRTLIAKREALHQELLIKERLQQQLSKRQQAFDQEKRHRMALVKSLSADIQNQQKILLDVQHNKDNLTRLLTTLVQRSVLQTRHPLSQMRRKLKSPVAMSNGTQKINQGIVFFAKEGSPVMSVAPGKIVFSDWLNGYGLLLIVDHGWGFMTLYANNKALLKHKGALVAQGEHIASVGHSGTLQKNGLYFEIRQRGKAVNPQEWMS